MQKSIITIMTVIIISASIGGAICHSDGNCKGKNPYLGILEAGQVQIFEQIQSGDDTKCGNEWAEFGTCCEIESLKQYAHNDEEEIKKSAAEVSQMLLELAKSIQDTIKFSASNSGKPFTKLFLKTAIDFLNSNVIKEKTQILTQIQKSTEIINSVQQCWDLMAKFRAHSLCSTCSGRSEIYFMEGQGVISSESCTAILDKCAMGFQAQVNTLDVVERILEVFGKIKEIFGRDASKISHLIQTLEEFFRREREHQFRQKIIKYYSSLTARTPELKAELCDSILRISKRTFIVNIGDILKNTIEVLNSIFQFLHSQAKLPIVSHVQTQVQNWVRSSPFNLRFLEVQTKSDDLFKGDTMTLVPTGLKISSVDTTHRDRKGTPLNVSVMFP